MTKSIETDVVIRAADADVVDGPPKRRTPLPDPYAYIEEFFPGVEVRAADLGTDWGLTTWDSEGHATVYYACDLGDIQRRCVLFHEIRHLHRGPPCSARCPVDEADCREETARWLLPDARALGETVAHYSVAEAADRLGVLPSIIHDRVDSFTDEELASYRAAFEPLTRSSEPSAACNIYSAPRRTLRDRKHHCRRVPILDEALLRNR